MGPKPSKESTNSKVIRVIQQNTHEHQRTATILLLGAGDTGKTTVFKQLIMSKSNGLQDADVKTNKDGILENVATGIKQLATSREWDGDLVPVAEFLIENTYDPKKEIELTEEWVVAARRLWEAANDDSEEIRKFFRTENLADNLGVMMENLQRFPEWGGKDWIPSPADCLLTRIMTTGVRKMNFMSGQRYFEVIDVGGQQGERKRWMPLFSKMTAVIYIISLSDYDKCLFESTQVNRLKDQVTLFRGVIRQQEQYFKRTAFIRFFNKHDLFHEKYFVQKVPLAASGILGGPLVEDNPTEREVIQWFKEILVEELENVPRFKDHVTCALDTQLMSRVITDCERQILEGIFQGVAKNN